MAAWREPNMLPLCYAAPLVYLLNIRDYSKVGNELERIVYGLKSSVDSRKQCAIVVNELYRTVHHLQSFFGSRQQRVPLVGRRVAPDAAGAGVEAGRSLVEGPLARSLEPVQGPHRKLRHDALLRLPLSHRLSLWGPGEVIGLAAKAT